MKDKILCCPQCMDESYQLKNQRDFYKPSKNLCWKHVADFKELKEKVKYIEALIK